MTTQAATSAGGWPSAAANGTAAGVVAGIIVLFPVVILQAMRGVGVLLELQLTASSLMGKSAYASAVGPLLAGAALHFLVSIGSGVVWALTAWRVPLLNRWAWISGPAFGAGVFFFMGLVVIPLSVMAPPFPTAPMPFVPSLLIHMFGFGLPIALFVRRRMGWTG